MKNSNSKAGTKVPKSTNADVPTSSQTIAKPIVVGSFNWSNVTNNKNVIQLIKQREKIENKIRAIDGMALVKYELEALQMS